MFQVRRSAVAGVVVALIAAACGGGTGADTTTTTAATTTTAGSTTTTTLPAGVTALLDLDHYPSGILVDGDVIWTEDHAQTGRVYAVDPTTGESLAVIPVSRPCDVVATPGRIWVAELAGGKISWIDTTTREVGGAVSGVAGPCGLQFTDGALWFTVDGGLARLDLESEEVTVNETRGAFPGSGLPLWAADFGDGTLIRIDTATGEIELTVPHPGGPIEGPPVAAGFDSLWVGGADALFRLDPVTGEVVAEIPVAWPSRLLVTANSIWLTSFDRGVVERIDPVTNTVVFHVDLGGSPNGIAFGFDSVLVSDTLRGRIYFFDPAATGVTP